MTPEEIQRRIQEVKDNHLTELDLSNKWDTPNSKKLTEIPAEVFELEGLEKLYLSNNQLREIPETLTRLSNLSQLDLSDNQLREIPETLTRLSNLSQLNLSYNQLTEIPETLSRLSNLSQLNLSDNRLREIPETLTRLSNLSQLNLSYNQLTEIPETLSRLSNLSVLGLSNNQLREIPETLTRLSNLSYLDLSNNQLREIPKTLTRLSHLSRLYLSNNQLREIPETLTRLSHLSRLYLDNNPLEIPPLEIAEQGIDAIRDYFQQRNEGEDKLYEAKLIIVGEGAVGKTTLMKKILDKTYNLYEHEPTTEGIEVQEYHFMTPDNNDFRVNIWDFGGQEIYHATHQFFLTKRSLYLLVADSRLEANNLDYWLDIVELLSEKSPLLIIKNEKDGRLVNVDETRLKSLFGNVKDSFITNLADNRGLEEIIRRIHYHIQKLPHIGSTLPKTWIKVRETLEQLTQDNVNYITLDQYYQICEQHNFHNLPNIPTSQEGTQENQNLLPFQEGTKRKSINSRLNLSQYLHDIGVILHFQHDIKSSLYKTLILNRKWGIDAIYKVLDNPQVKQQLGKFTTANINQIWQDEQYQTMQGELLQLMLEFKLAYPLSHHPNTYIAPQLLDINQTNYHWDGENNLLLRYQYDFMPKGILTRFIVESHRLIDEPNVWRTGVLLKQNNTYAEVIETYDKKEIRIRLSGNNQRELLIIIADKFDEINLIYNFNERLQVRKLIPCNCPACKNDPNPTFYNYQDLKDRYAIGVLTINNCKKNRYQDINVLSLIDDVIGRENFLKKEQREDRYSQENHYHFYDQVDEVKIQTTQKGENSMTPENNPKPIKVKSAWANGSFYLFVFIVVIALIGFLADSLALVPFIFVIVAGVLFIPIIGALQLRQDNRLSEKSFIELMKMVIGQLPLIGNMLGNILNPSKTDQKTLESPSEDQNS